MKIDEINQEGNDVVRNGLNTRLIANRGEEPTSSMTWSRPGFWRIGMQKGRVRETQPIRMNRRRLR